MVGPHEASGEIRERGRRRYENQVITHRKLATTHRYCLFTGSIWSSSGREVLRNFHTARSIFLQSALVSIPTKWIIDGLESIKFAWESV